MPAAQRRLQNDLKNEIKHAWCSMRFPDKVCWAHIALYSQELDIASLEKTCSCPLQDNIMKFNVDIMPDDGDWRGARFEFEFSIPNDYPVGAVLFGVVCHWFCLLIGLVRLRCVLPSSCAKLRSTILMWMSKCVHLLYYYLYVL